MLRKIGALLHRDSSVRYRAYDGAGNVEAWTDGFVEWVDLTRPLVLPMADWVLSLEVGEHIPSAYEAQYLSNLHAHNRCGIILSWARLRQEGQHHVNNHRYEYVASSMASLGYVLNRNLTQALRRGPSVAGLSPLPWLKDSVMAFDRARPTEGGGCG